MRLLHNWSAALFSHMQKLGFLRTRLRWFLSFLHKNLWCGYSFELPRQGNSNEHRGETILMSINNSNHRFAIETGRFRKVPRNERWCIFCKKQSDSIVEDEKHLLLHCPLYEIHRKQLSSCVYELCPNFKHLNVRWWTAKLSIKFRWSNCKVGC